MICSSVNLLLRMSVSRRNGFYPKSGAFMGSRSLLQQVARIWIVSDTPNSADAIIVLGGGLDVRPAAAAELYRQGLAPRVAVGFSELDQGQDEALNRTMLLRHGVPATAITNFSFRPHSTYGEARRVLEWAKINGIKSVIVPIDIFPSRRVRWISTASLLQQAFMFRFGRLHHPGTTLRIGGSMSLHGDTSGMS